MTATPPRQPDHAALVDALRLAERRGAFGPRSTIEALIAHAGGFVAALDDVPNGGRIVDLGAGGGIPGLVIATLRTDLELLLVDRRQARVDLLRRMVHRLQLDDRVEVVAADARRLADGDWAPVDAAVARGFATPIVTIETAVLLVRPDGGVLVISEPPDGHRWSDTDAARIAELGLRHVPFRAPTGSGRVAVLVRST